MKNEYQFVIKGQDDTVRAFASINGNVVKLKDITKQTAVAVAGLTTAFGLLTAKSIANAREIDTLSKLAGVSAEEFQSLSYAFERFNVNQDKFADISKDVQDKLGDFIATGAGPFKDFFEQVAPKVGLTVDALRELSSTDVLIAVKKAMDDANVSAKEQVFYMESIASDATLLLPALKDNGKAIKDYADEFERLNLAMSATEIEKMKLLSDETARFQKTVDSLGNKIVSQFIDPMSDLVDFIDENLEEHLMRAEMAFTGLAKGMLRTAEAGALVLKYNPASAVAAWASDIDLGSMAKNFGGAADLLDEELSQLDQRIRELSNPNFGETGSIFDGLDLFNTENAVTNITASGERISGALNDTFASMYEGFGEGDLFDTFKLPEIDLEGFTAAYEEASAVQSDFWGSLRDHIQVTTEDFDSMWGNTFDRFAAGIGDATATAIFEQQSFGEAAKEIARGAIQSLISGLVELGVKYVAFEALKGTISVAGNSALVAATAPAATAIGSMWATPAALASLATGGGNSIAANAGILSTVGLSESLALAGSFEGGGYIPDGARVGGLDGRGGRLAMVHPDETILDHKAGQGMGGGITIHQNATFYGSDRDMVFDALAKDRKKTVRLIQSAMSIRL